MTDDLKRTPLYEEHQRAGGKIVPFAGWEMPVQYRTGIVAEHHKVRQAAGLFDVCHMGELEIHGPQALDLVQHVTTNDASTLAIGQAQYSVICQEDGGAVDDCIVYRFPGHYLIVVNASNAEKDRRWIEQYVPQFDARLVDRSDDTGLIALQGPLSEQILARLTSTELSAIRYYHFAEGEVAGVPAVISRTGYTGEDGFEIALPAAETANVWRRLLEAGAPEGVAPIGLGARDSLRLEMGYALYGNDIDGRRTPLEAGLARFVRMEKGPFAGREALAKQLERGVPLSFITLEVHGVTDADPLGNEPIFTADGTLVGRATSGYYGHCLRKSLAIGYVKPEFAAVGTELVVEVLGYEPVQRGGPPILHALELGEEIGVEHLVEQPRARGLVLGAPRCELGGVDVDGGPEVAEAAERHELAHDLPGTLHQALVGLVVGRGDLDGVDVLQDLCDQVEQAALDCGQIAFELARPSGELALLQRQTELERRTRFPHLVRQIAVVLHLAR